MLIAARPRADGSQIWETLPYNVGSFPTSVVKTVVTTVQDSHPQAAIAWVLRQCRNGRQSRLFRQSTHEIEVLYGLAGRALDQIVDHRKHYHRALTLGLVNGELTAVDTAHMAGFRMGTGG
ncbi:hypothetical protein CCP4SC76_3890001 [Gammaproteobacteria bacterium]